MANIKIADLPAAQPIDGTELVPIVQSGITVRATTAAVAGSPSQQQTFITVNQETTLPNSRAITSVSGIGITDNGAQSTISISLQGAAASLNTAGTGFAVKTGTNTITPRNIVVSGSGIAIADGDGQSGNPTISLDGQVLALANASGAGFVALNGSGGLNPRQITGTASQINVTNGTGAAGSPVISMVNTAVTPGTYGSSSAIPVVTVDAQGRVTTVSVSPAIGGGTVTSISALNLGTIGTDLSSTVADPTTTPVITLNVPTASATNRGALSAADWITFNSKGSGTVTDVTGTAPVVSSGGSTPAISMPQATTSIDGYLSATDWNTFNGKGSGTVTSITAGTGLTGGLITSTGTIAIDSTVATLTGVQTLTNKTISGASNTLTNIGNSSLTNSAVTIGTTSISLGSSSLTLGGLTSVALTQDPVSALQAATKQYVDAAISNINYHAACNYGTTADLGTVTYNNGTSGVGATITNGGAQVALVIDGHIFTATDVTNAVRILVKNETNGEYNGVYTLTNQGSILTNWVLTRATDYDQVGSGVNEIAPGDTMFILSGTINTNTQWVQTTEFPITIGTTPINFVQIAGPGAYTAGTGLNLTGTQFSLISPVSVSLGGTGSTTAFTQYGVAYGSTTSAMATTASGTSVQLLHGNASGAPTWSAVSLTTDVSGILPIANGGTNSTATATAGGAGYGTGTAHAYTAAGTAGQVLTSTGAGAPTWSGISGGTF